MITLTEVLKKMHDGEYFSLKCVTFDRNRKDRTGKVLFIERGKLVWGNSDKVKPKSITERAPTAMERELIGDTKPKTRQPDHKHNDTRNVRQYIGELPTEDIRKIHFRLIVEFNGEPITI